MSARTTAGEMTTACRPFTPIASTGCRYSSGWPSLPAKLTYRPKSPAEPPDSKPRTTYRCANCWCSMLTRECAKIPRSFSTLTARRDSDNPAMPVNFCLLMKVTSLIFVMLVAGHESAVQEPHESFLSCSPPSTDRTVDLRPGSPSCRHCDHAQPAHKMDTEPRSSSP